MKRIIGIFCVLVCLTLSIGCGDDEAENDGNSSPESEPSVEERFTEVLTKINSVEQDIASYSCRCFWSNNYDSEDECLDKPHLRQDEETVNACLSQAFDEAEPYEGDLEPLVDCWEDMADKEYQCIESVSDTCSEENRSERWDCVSDDEFFACMTLGGGEELEEWFEYEYLDNAFAICSLAF